MAVTSTTQEIQPETVSQSCPNDIQIILTDYVY
jgi:hypothetical protein